MAGYDQISDMIGGRRTWEELKDFQPKTREALVLIEGWTESEAINGWFFMAGAHPEIVAEMHAHIMKMRELAGRPRP